MKRLRGLQALDVRRGATWPVSPNLSSVRWRFSLPDLVWTTRSVSLSLTWPGALLELIGVYVLNGSDADGELSRHRATHMLANNPSATVITKLVLRFSWKSDNAPESTPHLIPQRSRLEFR